MTVGAAIWSRLSPADVRMAKELGFKPRSLLKNQPSPQQPWKAPVAEWGPRPVCQTPTPQRAAAPTTRTRAGRNGGPDKRRPLSDHSDIARRPLTTRPRRCRICHERDCPGERVRCSECVRGRLPLPEALGDELGPLAPAPAVQHL